MRRSHPHESGETAANEAEEQERGREEDAGGRTLLGLDLRWARPTFELEAEGTLLPSTHDQPYEGGAFASLAVRLVDPLWAVGRAEVYRPVEGGNARLGFLGLTYRPDPRLVVKLGRQLSRHPSTRIPDGWFLSFSSLF
jgi:hypothetical protein